MPADFLTISKFTPAEAREFLECVRWGEDGTICPHCNCKTAYKITPKQDSSTRVGVYKCKACRKQFTVTVGTIMEGSHIPLNKWLIAIYLMCASKKSMSAHQIHRTLKVTYKSAWFMCHRIRLAMTQEPLTNLLKGNVEVDETYVGGKHKGKRGRGAEGKTPVVALVERGGELRARQMKRLTSSTLKAEVYRQVDVSAHIHTDEFRSYQGLGKVYASHQTVQHGCGQYVNGNCYTNTLEGWFSLLKRGVNGTFHHVSGKHLDRYVDEFVFRYNNRKINDSERAIVAIIQVDGKRLTYETLKSNATMDT